MCPTHRVALVDDETPSRRLLKRIVDAHGQFRVIAEASTGRQAIQTIRSHAPDLIFLDVDMPDIDGFDVLRALAPDDRPLVVFCSGHEELAIEAFAVDAVDFVLKPVHGKRVHNALDRAAIRLSDPDEVQRQHLEAMLLESQGHSWVQRLPIRHGHRLQFVEIEDVSWIGAAGNYVELHVDGHRHLYRSTLTELVRRLDPRRFARIHRSSVVNLQYVREIWCDRLGDWHVRLDTGDELRLSRHHRDVVHRLLCSGTRNTPTAR